MRKLALVSLLAFVLPGVAHAGDVAMRVQEVPLGHRTLAATAPAQHFNMLGLHWTGSGTVAYRVHRLHGQWGAWVAADSDGNRTGAWNDGQLDWTGAADAIRFRTAGVVQRLRAYELWSRVSASVTRGLSEAGSPAIVPRSGWGANEEIVRAKPHYAPALKLAVVHHTAGTNDYTRAQSAAIVRGIEVYHVQGNGWNDIGYNFLIDRYGTVYEGRAGGIERNVIGAHALGFNAGTVGVSLIGNYASATPPKAQQEALVRLLAWRLDIAHVDPLSRVVYTSGGNAKFRAGKVVTLRAISGHRDTGPSECPGNGAYALLPSIGRQVAATGLPKLYSPTVVGSLGGPIRFRARLSSAAPWTVTVTDASGKTVARGTGTGSLVDWTWSSPAGRKGYTWTISSSSARPVIGTLGGARPRPPTAGAPVSVSDLKVSPGLVAPTAGGVAPVTVSFTLGAPAQATVQVVAPDGTAVPLEDGQLPAGPNTVRFDASPLVDGRYKVTVTAKATTTASASVPLVVDRTVTSFTASAAVVSPNADGVDDSVAFTFNLSQATPVQLEIVEKGNTVATAFSGALQPGAQTIQWDGTGNGSRLPDGAYTAVLVYTDALGSLVQSAPVTVDTTPPTLTLLAPQTLQFSLDEPATVTVVVNGQTTIVHAEPKGTFTVPFTGAVTSLTAHAVDAAGNTGATVSG
jgi:N-acetylmuramoyl-L-alanine amidase/FlgD Ig-like domain